MSQCARARYAGESPRADESHEARTLGQAGAGRRLRSCSCAVREQVPSLLGGRTYRRGTARRNPHSQETLCWTKTISVAVNDKLPPKIAQVQAATSHAGGSKTWTAVGEGVCVGFDAPGRWEHAGAVPLQQIPLYD